MEICGRRNFYSQKINMFLRVMTMLGVISTTLGKRHDLILTDDDRKRITLSSFGFLKGGTLSVNITNFNYKLNSKTLPDENVTLFGFTLDKSGSTGLSYMESEHTSKCFLQYYTTITGDKTKDQMSVVFFKMDLVNERVIIERVGNDVTNLTVSNLNQKEYRDKKHDQRKTRREAIAQSVANNNLLRRQTRDSEGDPEVKESSVKTPPTTTLTSAAPSAAPTVIKVKTNPTSKNNTNISTKAPVKPETAVSKETTPDVLRNQVDIKKNKQGNYDTHFLVVINSETEEGLYSLFFHNCLNFKPNVDSTVTMTLQVVEENNGNYLSAGSQPEPTLFFVFFLSYFICGCIWLSVLRKAEKNDVYKIHYLMLAVVWVKSVSCLFHGINSHFIAKSGIPDEAWAILWYIVYLTKGALMFGTILLIGAGWDFIEHMLSHKEKKLFAIFLPLQVLKQVAWVIIEESDEGQFHYTTWKQIFFVVDLLCCVAILFTVAWSIRHLQEASAVDGKAAMNLNKLKFFRHFYIMVVCYIYFTRMIVYLLKITLPFRHEWLTEFFREIAVFLFLFVTGYKFRPASNNPYLQVPQDSDDEIEMEEVLTKNATTDTLSKVNQQLVEKKKNTNKQEDGIKQRESSLEYD
ncbi:protein GPR107-like isoform X1 [Patella vulgata]|uniref:protein GPR107-like isoform X1 n=1 Tax=Patella vulgata TaxID=6465 RepID=UPI0024A964D5|nr:protein GPR107-like isoform X1 [Patella vulgata]